MAELPFRDVAQGAWCIARDGDGHQVRVQRLMTLPRKLRYFCEATRRWRKYMTMTNAVDEDGTYYMVDLDCPARLAPEMTTAEALAAIRQIAEIDDE